MNAEAAIVILAALSIAMSLVGAWPAGLFLAAVALAVALWHEIDTPDHRDSRDRNRRR